ncbi:MAG: hypothetical protein R2708_23385 [Vicinamibacterales bacterium]
MTVSAPGTLLFTDDFSRGLDRWQIVGAEAVALHDSRDPRHGPVLYVRPDNGRADDQVRRNHATRYAAFPAFDVARLRKESPERYESYVDLERGAWTRLRVEVRGTTMRLYVHDAPQPALVVNDLKLGDDGGGVALWIGPGTDGSFGDLVVRGE